MLGEGRGHVADVLRAVRVLAMQMFQRRVVEHDSHTGTQGTTGTAGTTGHDGYDGYGIRPPRGLTPV